MTKTDSGSKTSFLNIPKTIFKNPAALLLKEPFTVISNVLGIPPAAYAMTPAPGPELLWLTRAPRNRPSVESIIVLNPTESPAAGNGTITQSAGDVE